MCKIEYYPSSVTPFWVMSDSLVLGSYKSLTDAFIKCKFENELYHIHSDFVNFSCFENTLTTI